MEKRTDVQIFEMAHKLPEYGLNDNSLYTPIHTGANDNKSFVCLLKDNVADNISDTNYFFCEETGTYWVWKNIDLSPYKYVGQCQYRRRLIFKENENFDKIFEKYDIILPTPLLLKEMTINEQYSASHNVADLRALGDVVMKMYPEYTNDWSRYVVNGNFLFYSASYIMRKEDYLAWCEFLFSVMEEYRKSYLDYNDKDIVRKHVVESGKWTFERDIIYQMRIGGYLCERLFTLWVRHKFPADKMFIEDYVLKENKK